MAIYNEDKYTDKAAKLNHAICMEKAVLSDLVEDALRRGEPIASPEILEQNAKVSQLIEDYNNAKKEAEK